MPADDRRDEGPPAPPAACPGSDKDKWFYPNREAEPEPGSGAGSNWASGEPGDAAPRPARSRKVRLTGRTQGEINPD